MSIEGIIPSTTGRRNFLKVAGLSSLGLAGAAAFATKLGSPMKAEAAGIDDADILNFALNLEYLEAEYYCVATTGMTLVELGFIDDTDTTGPTVGGGLIPDLKSFSPASYLSNALRINEVEHVLLLRNALGPAAVKKPAINLGALGYGFTSHLDFFKITRQLEEVGTSAYLGAAPLITSKAYLAVAASILTVEAKHTGALRLACIQAGVKSPAVDRIDVPPATNYPFDAPTNGLTTPRTTTQVLSIVYGGGSGSGGFYPAGMNGTIK